MLADLEPPELVEARAAFRVIPLDDGWQQAGTIAATIHNEMEKFFAMKAGKRRIDERDLRKPDDYIPKIRRKKRGIKVNQASIDAYQQMIQQQYVNHR
jgi:hypothetical protein